MVFLEQRLQRRTRELERYRFREMVSLFPFKGLEDEGDRDTVHTTIPDALRSSGQELEQGALFAGRDRYLWLRRVVTIPPAKEGCQVFGLFDFGRTGPGSTSGFESLLYVDGHPYQGVDTNHNDVNLENFAGQTVELVFLLWSGLEGGGQPREQFHRLQTAQMGYLHLETDRLYYLAKAIYKTLRYLPEEDPIRSRLGQSLDAAFDRIDWDADQFYDTVGEALSSLEQALDHMEKQSEVTVWSVGHTHIDVAWLWRLKHTREKAMRSFSTACRLMEEFPEFVFLQTQPQLYSYIKEDAPEIYQRMREKAARGQWEAQGGMWLEADCNIPSGESLVRQLLKGIAFLKREFGADCTYLWLPDVFGYSWALPQILKQCHIDTFMTTKISWNQFNTIPNDLFLWRGIDGSEVLTYFITTPDSGDFQQRFTTYNGLMSPRTVVGSWKKFKNKELTRDILLAYGYGDGGGGVNRNMLKMARAMERLPGLPHVKLAKAGEFFEKLHENVERTEEKLPTWDGELYLEYHRGTYTTQAENKRKNRRAENALFEAEWLSCLEGGDYPCQLLEDGWEILLRNQFHDIIPGSSIREVYEDSDREYAVLFQKAEEARDRSLAGLLQARRNAYTVLDSSPLGGAGAVELPVREPGVFRNWRGCRLLSQIVDNGTLVWLESEPLTLNTVFFEPGLQEEEPSPFSISLEDGTADTPFYRLSWNQAGQLTSLYDKENSRQVLRGTGNQLELYEDKPLDHDAWDIDLFYTRKKEVLACSRVELRESGSVRAVIRFTYRFRHSTLEQDLVLYAGSRRLDFVTRVDWHEDHRLLKVAFDTSIRSTKATYDIQFGHVERPTHYNTSWDLARFEVVGHKWADLSDDSYGVSLLNDCKYGYSVHDHVMTLSLLKSSKHPDYAADMGEHMFTYALLPHEGTVTRGNTIPESWRLNRPYTAISGQAQEPGKRLAYVEGSGVCIDAVKKAEDGDDLVVRLHECLGGRAKGRLVSDWRIRSAVVCDLLEVPCGEPLGAGPVELELSPFELRTYRIRLDR